MKKLTYIIGRHGIEINIHGCQPYPGNSHLCTEISKLWIYTPLYSFIQCASYDSSCVSHTIAQNYVVTFFRLKTWIDFWILIIKNDHSFHSNGTFYRTLNPANAHSRRGAFFGCCYFLPFQFFSKTLLLKVMHCYVKMYHFEKEYFAAWIHCDKKNSD